MKLLERPLGALALLEIPIYRDERGFFLESFRADRLAGLGIEGPFVQGNHSRSTAKVLRGLHYQTDPAQGKLVSVTRGRIWDVAVDLRRGSPTRGEFFATELNDGNGRQLWIPPGFAHGFCVLGDEPADVTYKVTGFYNPRSEGGLRWSDPTIALPWPVKDPVVSAKDQALPLFADVPEL